MRIKMIRCMKCFTALPAYTLNEVEDGEAHIIDICNKCLLERGGYKRNQVESETCPPSDQTVYNVLQDFLGEGSDEG